MRTAVFFDLDDVLALVVFLAFGLTIARFDDLDFACLALFFHILFLRALSCLSFPFDDASFLTHELAISFNHLVGAGE